MQFDEMGNLSGKTLMLLPGTACDYQTNFATVLDRLGEKYHRAEICKPFTKKYADPEAPYDGYIEDDDTEEKARSVRLAKKKG